MVEPRRRCFSLPAVDLKKKAVGGIFSVTIVSARDLAKLDHRESRHNTANGDGSGHGHSNGSSHSSHGSNHSSSQGTHHGSSGSANRKPERFVEIQCEDLTRKTGMQSGNNPHVWNETYDMVLHDNVGSVHINVYEKQRHNSVKYDFLGSCEIKVDKVFSLSQGVYYVHFSCNIWAILR
jgi:ABC-type Zn2+ transport system substrate-binding protein/surface adhesin